MEKQGLKFFILRALAHQLQNWADFVFKQVGEEGRSAQWNQANAERADTGSVADASREVSSPMPDMGSAGADNPPAHWLTRAGAGEPPAHWLARVQKDAPELLKQKGHSTRNVATQSHPLPTEQTDGSGQTADAEAGQRARMGKIMQAEEDSSELAETDQREGEEGRVHRDEMQSHPLSAGQADGSGQTADAGAGQRARMSEIMQAEEDSSELAEIGKREGEESGAHRDEMDVPASLWNVATQSHPLPAGQADGSAQTADAGQRARMGEIMRAEEDSNGLTEISKREGEEGGARRNETNVPTSPNSMAKWNEVERIGPVKGPMRTSKPNMHPTLPPEGWPSSPMMMDSSMWEERSGMRSNQQAAYNLWPQASIAATARDHQSLRLGEASEQIQTEMRWPSLPEEVTTDSQDWEMVWRVWERQQRLDEEQRGRSWNA